MVPEEDPRPIGQELAPSEHDHQQNDLVAVIIAYWPQRIGNIPVIIDDLNAGSVKPDKIIVFNNNPAFTIAEKLNTKVMPDNVSYVESSSNLTSRSKYAIAMLEPAPNYVLLDDDVSVMHGTVEAFLKHMEPGRALCDYGVNMKDNYLSNGDVVKGVEIKNPRPIDAFIGRCQVLSFEAIIKVFEAEAKIRVPNLPHYRSVGEDILVAMCNEEAYIVPLPPDAQMKFVHLGDHMMQNDWGYMIYRDKFTYDMRHALGLPLWDGHAPGDEHDMKAIRAYLDTLGMRDKGLVP